MATRYSTLLLISQLQSELEREMTEAAGTSSLAEPNWAAAGPPPPTDVFETERAMIVVVEVPGLDAREIMIEINGHELVLRGHRRPLKTDEGTARFHCMERSRGTFERKIALPDTLDPRRATARLAKGVLTLELPRISRDRRGPHQVPIDVED